MFLLQSPTMAGSLPWPRWLALVTTPLLLSPLLMVDLDTPAARYPTAAASLLPWAAPLLFQVCLCGPPDVCLLDTGATSSPGWTTSSSYSCFYLYTCLNFCFYLDHGLGYGDFFLANLEVGLWKNIASEFNQKSAKGNSNWNSNHFSEQFLFFLIPLLVHNLGACIYLFGYFSTFFFALAHFPHFVCKFCVQIV